LAEWIAKGRLHVDHKAASTVNELVLAFLK
jgi:hypothetical protein